jgi:peptidoglycan hydrolase CwlO-like protein
LEEYERKLQEQKEEYEKQIAALQTRLAELEKVVSETASKQSEQK